MQRIGHGALCAGAILGVFAGAGHESLASDDVAGALTQALEASLAGALDGRLEGEVLRVPNALRKVEPDSIRVEWLKAPREGTQSVVVRVEGRSADRGKPSVRKFFVPVRLRAPRHVLVATRSLVAGELIQEGDVVLKPRIEDSTHRGTSLDPRALIGVRVFDGIAAGETVTKSALELPAPVARGTEVDVVVRRRALTIATRGTLERGTRPGTTAIVRVEGGGIEGGTRLVRGVLVGTTVLAGEGAAR